jgi:hypothetical protein
MAKEHWAEAGDGVRGRVFRAAALNRVLDHFGLSVASWAGGSYVVRDRKGGTAVVGDLGALWMEAERLVGRPLDPLDPTLIAALEA